MQRVDFMPDYFDITFLPEEKTVASEMGTTLFEAAASCGYELRYDCGGNGTCGKCRVAVAGNDKDEFVDLPACQVKIDRPLYVRIPVGSLVCGVREKKVLLESGIDPAEFRRSENPMVRKTFLRLTPAARENETPDLQRLAVGLGIPDLHVRLELLRNLPRIIRADESEKGTWTATGLTCGNDLVDLFPGFDPGEYYTLAVDLGTTTLAVAISPVSSPENAVFYGIPNPQSEFGDDIISRIRAGTENPGNIVRLRESVVNAINYGIGRLAKEHGIEPGRIVAASFAGNTAMQQFFLGLDSSPLGFSPFVPCTRNYPDFSAAELGLDIHSGAPVHILPVIGGFVGGDLVAGIYATKILETGETSLLVDIGTNGEMILVHKGAVFATATAAGPAFEGAGITHGLPAVPGAISRVSRAGGSGVLEFETISGEKRAVGICGSGLIDLIAELLRAGAVLPNGRFNTGSEINGVNWLEYKGKTVVLLAGDEKSARSGDAPVVLTQRDIRQVQLASGAIRTGIVLLLEQAGIDAGDLDSICLAGGFGQHIDPVNAFRIGLFPDGIAPERIRFCGNTALAGARLSLTERSAFEKMNEISKRAIHIDLSHHPDFQTTFAAAMIFPTIGE